MRTPLPFRALAFIAVAVTFTAGSGDAHAQTYFFDFGSGQGTPEDASFNVWNTVPNSVTMTSDQMMSGILDTANNFSTLQLEMVSRFNGENGDGTQASPLFPATATRDSMYGNTANWQGLADVTPKFKLTGLDPTKAYNFTFYASRMLGGSTEDRTTQYVVTGSAAGSTQLNALNNVGNVAQLSNVMPLATPQTTFGEVLVELFPGATNANQYKFTYLGVLKVEAVPEPTSALMLASGVGILALRRRRRTA